MGIIPLDQLSLLITLWKYKHLNHDPTPSSVSFRQHKAICSQIKKKKNFSLVTMLGFLLQNIILPVSNIVIEFFQTAAEM